MVVFFIFMPETPRWLLAHNQRQKALQGLRWLRGSLYDVEGECSEIESNLGLLVNSVLITNTFLNIQKLYVSFIFFPF